MARSGDIEVILDVNRKAYRRQLLAWLDLGSTRTECLRHNETTIQE